MWKTSQMNRCFLALVALTLLVALQGCAAKPQLLARDAGNPAGTDLSGRWELRNQSGAPPSEAGGPEPGIRLPPASSSRSRQGASRAPRSSRSKSPAVHVFIENGKLLKITQTEFGLFISFDRAVVEEFTFGENRMVSLGPIEAQRVSGWQGADFVVETMDAQGVTLRETWGQVEGGDVLNRDLVIVDDEKELYSARQVFERL